MKPENFMALTGVILLVTIVIVTGALFSGIVYSAQPDIINMPFHKFIGHVTLLTGIISCFIYLKITDVPLIKGFGFGRNKNIFMQLILKGWLFGLLILSVLIMLYLVLGIYIIEEDLKLSLLFITKLFIKTLLAGSVIAIIEESIFRGALFSGLEKKGGPLLAVIITSLLYASVHFIKYRQAVPAVDIYWFSGVLMIPDALYRFSDPAIIDSFLTLAVLGVFLSITRLKTGNIALAIGIHAGIVMVMKISRDITDYVDGNNLALLVNKYDHLLGILAVCWLACLCIIYYRLTGTRYMTD